LPKLFAFFSYKLDILWIGWSNLTVEIIVLKRYNL
jgi:hypothetical protein